MILFLSLSNTVHPRTKCRNSIAHQFCIVTFLKAVGLVCNVLFIGVNDIKGEKKSLSSCSCTTMYCTKSHDVTPLNLRFWMMIFFYFFGRSLFALGLTETLEFLQDLNLEKRWSRMTLNLKSNFSEAAAARIVAINLHRSSWKLASFHPCCLLHFSRKNARDKICNLAAAAISHCLKITQNVPLKFF